MNIRDQINRLKRQFALDSVKVSMRDGRIKSEMRSLYLSTCSINTMPPKIRLYERCL